jgi:ABC-type lipoprotein release transport system permease subunit
MPLHCVAPTDPVTLVVACLLLAALSLLAAWIPARRASHMDPLAALRAE